MLISLMTKAGWQRTFSLLTSGRSNETDDSMWTFRGPRISESAKTASKWYVCSIYFMFPFYFTPENLCWGSVTNVRACEPEPQAASREPFLRATAFILIYSFIFWRFQFNVNVFLSKWCTWQKKHKFSIFFRAWNFAQVVSVVCWRSVYSFRYEWNFELPSQIFVSKCWLCKID